MRTVLVHIYATTASPMKSLPLPYVISMTTGTVDLFSFCVINWIESGVDPFGDSHHSSQATSHKFIIKNLSYSKMAMG